MEDLYPVGIEKSSLTYSISGDIATHAIDRHVDRKMVSNKFSKL